MLRANSLVLPLLFVAVAVNFRSAEFVLNEICTFPVASAVAVPTKALEPPKFVKGVATKSSTRQSVQVVTCTAPATACERTGIRMSSLTLTLPCVASFAVDIGSKSIPNAPARESRI